MEAIPTPRIEARWIQSPIQLLAAAVAAMAVLTVSFLVAAGLIREPPWAPAVLVIAGVSCMIVALGIIVLGLTRFRDNLLGDDAYLKLKRIEEYRFRRFRPILSDRISGGAQRVPTADQTERMRIARYVANQGMFLSYDWRPSVAKSQAADIVLRLTQHVSNEGLGGPLSRGEVEKVEYYLGPYFGGGGPIVQPDSTDGFRLDVSAHNPVLCIAAAYLRGRGQPILLEQYLDFPTETKPSKAAQVPDEVQPRPDSTGP